MYKRSHATIPIFAGPRALYPTGRPRRWGCPPPVLGLLVAAMVLLAGCGGDGRVQVTGSVTLDGEPLETGTIAFRPADGQGPTAGALITAGRYTVRVMPGPMFVEIQGFREVGRGRVVEFDPDSPIVAITEPIVPPKYNTATELQVEVSASNRQLDFALRR